MPDIPIIDAHLHLWDPIQMPIPWLAAVPALNRPFGIPEYAAQTAGVPIVSMVYIEVDVAPHAALVEVDQVVALAQHEPRLQGIVAAAPVELGEHVRPYLEALRARGPLVKGVRRNLQGETDPAFCLHRDFIHGVQLLGEYGFSFDLCIRPDQLPAVIALVRHCPAVAFLLDHMGKPAIQEQQLDPWREHLALLATLPNVACKVSGLVTEADRMHWQPEDLAPYVAHTLAVFGPERVLFGGDWPVVTLAATYPRWIATLDALTSHLPDQHQRHLWGENARSWYHLPLVEG